VLTDSPVLVLDPAIGARAKAWSILDPGQPFAQHDEGRHADAADGARRAAAADVDVAAVARRVGDRARSRSSPAFGLHDELGLRLDGPSVRQPAEGAVVVAGQVTKTVVRPVA